MRDDPLDQVDVGGLERVGHGVILVPLRQPPCPSNWPGARQQHWAARALARRSCPASPGAPLRLRRCPGAGAGVSGAGAGGSPGPASPSKAALIRAMASSVMSIVSADRNTARRSRTTTAPRSRTISLKIGLIRRRKLWRSCSRIRCNSRVLASCSARSLCTFSSKASASSRNSLGLHRRAFFGQIELFGDQPGLDFAVLGGQRLAAFLDFGRDRFGQRAVVEQGLLVHGQDRRRYLQPVLRRDVAGQQRRASNPQVPPARHGARGAWIRTGSRSSGRMTARCRRAAFCSGLEKLNRSGPDRGVPEDRHADGGPQVEAVVDRPAGAGDIVQPPDASRHRRTRRR